MSHTQDNTQLLKSPLDARATTIALSVPPLPNEHSFLGQRAQMVMEEVLGIMRPGDGLSRWHVKLSYGQNSDIILITLEARPTTQPKMPYPTGLRTWWSRLVSGIISSTKRVLGQPSDNSKR